MAVRIRLKRIGRRKRPFYRVVVMDSRTRRDGREIEMLGWFDPLVEGEKFKFDEERAMHWLKEGAQPSDRVKFIFKESGINLRWHLLGTGVPEEEIEEKVEAWRQEKAESQQVKADKAAAKAAEKVKEDTTSEEEDTELEPLAEADVPDEEPVTETEIEEPAAESETEPEAEQKKET